MMDATSRSSVIGDFIRSPVGDFGGGALLFFGARTKVVAKYSTVFVIDSEPNKFYIAEDFTVGQGSVLAYAIAPILTGDENEGVTWDLNITTDIVSAPGNTLIDGDEILTDSSSTEPSPTADFYEVMNHSDFPQISTVQIGVFDAATTYNVTIGGVTISQIGITNATTTAAALTASLAASVDPNFDVITWTSVGTVITGTADVAATPFVLTGSVTGGTGTIITATPRDAKAFQLSTNGGASPVNFTASGSAVRKLWRSAGLPSFARSYTNENIFFRALKTHDDRILYLATEFVDHGTALFYVSPSTGLMDSGDYYFILDAVTKHPTRIGERYYVPGQVGLSLGGSSYGLWWFSLSGSATAVGRWVDPNDDGVFTTAYKVVDIGDGAVLCIANCQNSAPFNYLTVFRVESNGSIAWAIQFQGSASGVGDGGIVHSAVHTDGAIYLLCNAPSGANLAQVIKIDPSDGSVTWAFRVASSAQLSGGVERVFDMGIPSPDGDGVLFFVFVGSVHYWVQVKSDGTIGRQARLRHYAQNVTSISFAGFLQSGAVMLRLDTPYAAAFHRFDLSQLPDSTHGLSLVSASIIATPITLTALTLPSLIVETRNTSSTGGDPNAGGELTTIPYSRSTMSID